METDQTNYKTEIADEVDRQYTKTRQTDSRDGQQAETHQVVKYQKQKAIEDPTVRKIVIGGGIAAIGLIIWRIFRKKNDQSSATSNDQSAASQFANDYQFLPELAIRNDGSGSVLINMPMTAYSYNTSVINQNMIYTNSGDGNFILGNYNDNSVKLNIDFGGLCLFRWTKDVFK